MGNHESHQKNKKKSKESTHMKSSMLSVPHPVLEPQNSATLTSRPRLANIASLSTLVTSSMSGNAVPTMALHKSMSSTTSNVPPSLLQRPQLDKNNQSSFANVSNGITGTHITSRISKIAARFWYQTIENLDMEQQLEIGCSIFFSAFSDDKEIRDVMCKNFKNKHKIEQKCLKFLDMIGWLLRHLLRDDIDLYSLLTHLGGVHQNMGIQIQHFDSMLLSMHHTFSYYFRREYTLEVKYSMDEIFTVAAQIMSGQDLSYSSRLHQIALDFQSGTDSSFLQNLRICLQSETGKEYFYQFLKQMFCDEIVLFLQAISQFRAQTYDLQRFMIARDLIRTFIRPNAYFTLNISGESRTITMNAFEALENDYINQQKVEINENFFIHIEEEIFLLILMNHWSIFKNNMKVLQSKSFGL